MNAKLLLFFLIITIIFISAGCSNKKSRIDDWDNIKLTPQTKKYKKHINWDIVEVGDILIQETDGNFLGWFGHSGIVVSEGAVAEIPKLGEKVYYRDINDWKLMRRVCVLRLKKIDNKFKYYLIKEVMSSIDRPYMILPKNSDWAYYCSQYIWRMFYNAGKKVGRDVDIDGGKGMIILPCDIIESNELEIVDYMKE